MDAAEAHKLGRRQEREPLWGMEGDPSGFIRGMA